MIETQLQVLWTGLIYENVKFTKPFIYAKLKVWYAIKDLGGPDIRSFSTFVSPRQSLKAVFDSFKLSVPFSQLKEKERNRML